MILKKIFALDDSRPMVHMYENIIFSLNDLHIQPFCTMVCMVHIHILQTPSLDIDNWFGSVIFIATGVWALICVIAIGFIANLADWFAFCDSIFLRIHWQLDSQLCKLAIANLTRRFQFRHLPFCI